MSNGECKTGASHIGAGGHGKALEPIQTVMGSSWRGGGIEKFTQEMEVNGCLRY